MSLKDDAKFQDYLHSCDNRYAAVQKVAAEARRRSDLCNNRILHSEAITWVVQGVVPDYVTNKPKGPLTLYEQSYFRELFCYIYEEEVCEAVKQSYIKTKKCKYLIYVYNNIQSESVKARVRILTRIAREILILKK